MAVLVRYVVHQIQNLLNVQTDEFYSEDRILAALDYRKDQLVEMVKVLGRRFFVKTSETVLPAGTDELSLPVEWTGTVLLGFRPVGGTTREFTVLDEWSPTDARFYTVRGGYVRMGRKLKFSGGGWPHDVVIVHTYEHAPPRFVLSGPGPNETDVTDDLLYPHWALIPGAIVLLVADDRYSQLTEEMSREWQIAQQRVVDNVVTSNERAVGHIEPASSRLIRRRGVSVI
jgi:hypothetical protein